MPDLSMTFGLYGLKHSSLIKNFYPEDLPSDWYLDYYSNEFDLLLVSQEEFDTFDDLDELKAEKNFLCLVNDFDMLPVENIGGIELQWSINDKTLSTLCIIRSDQQSSPESLRRIIEKIKSTCTEKNLNIIYLVFDGDAALENCRNAMILESMM